MARRSTAIYGRGSGRSSWRTRSVTPIKPTVHGSASFLARPRERRLPREVLRLHQILARSGSIDWAQQSAATFAEAAAREFQGCAFAGVPESPDLNWLRGCVDFLVQRDA